MQMKAKTQLPPFCLCVSESDVIEACMCQADLYQAYDLIRRGGGERGDPAVFFLSTPKAPFGRFKQVL